MEASPTSLLRDKSMTLKSMFPNDAGISPVSWL
jgi:hypothetical protein